MSFEKQITMTDGFLETKETSLGGSHGKSYIRFSQKVFVWSTGTQGFLEVCKHMSHLEMERQGSRWFECTAHIRVSSIRWGRVLWGCGLHLAGVCCRHTPPQTLPPRLVLSWKLRCMAIFQDTCFLWCSHSSQSKLHVETHVPIKPHTPITWQLPY